MLQLIAGFDDAGSRPRPLTFSLAFKSAALAASTLALAASAHFFTMKAFCFGKTTSTRTKPAGTVTVAGSRLASGTKQAHQLGSGEAASRSR